MEMTLDEIISKNLKEEIEQSGKTKTEIAKAIGVSNPTISQYLSGRESNRRFLLFPSCAVF